MLRQVKYEVLDFKGGQLENQFHYGENQYCNQLIKSVSPTLQLQLLKCFAVCDPDVFVTISTSNQ